MENRKVKYPNRFTVKKISGNGTFLKGTKSVILERCPRQIIEAGTLLTKELLQDCFDEKQDLLTAAENGGIIFTDEENAQTGIGIDFSDSGIVRTDYSHAAPKITSVNMETDYARWTATGTEESPQSVRSIALGDVRYRSARVDFTIKSLTFDADGAAEPEVFVKFDGENSCVAVVASILQNKIKLIKDYMTDNAEVTAQTTVSVSANQPVDVTVIRSTEDETGYSYLVFVNGVFKVKFTTDRDKTLYDYITIGLYNCNGVLEKWQIDGEF